MYATITYTDKVDVNPIAEVPLDRTVIELNKRISQDSSIKKINIYTNAGHLLRSLKPSASV